MAQNYCGSNNINLLFPSGQFGTRRLGGKDSASARYIFTRLEKITRAIFHPDDDALLNYLSDDGLSIEPEYFMPVIPMVLVNGSKGIGTGWSSTIVVGRIILMKRTCSCYLVQCLLFLNILILCNIYLHLFIRATIPVILFPTLGR